MDNTSQPAPAADEGAELPPPAPWLIRPPRSWGELCEGRWLDEVTRLPGAAICARWIPPEYADRDADPDDSPEAKS